MAGSIKVAGHELVRHDIATDKLVYGSGVPAGTVIQVKSHFFDTPLSNNSANYSKFLTITITPKFNTSKFFINAQINAGMNPSAFIYILLQRNTTDINVGT